MKEKIIVGIVSTLIGLVASKLAERALTKRIEVADNEVPEGEIPTDEDIKAIIEFPEEKEDEKTDEKTDD
jgi:hypothetical protein